MPGDLLASFLLPAGGIFLIVAGDALGDAAGLRSLAMTLPCRLCSCIFMSTSRGFGALAGLGVFGDSEGGAFLAGLLDGLREDDLLVAVDEAAVAFGAKVLEFVAAASVGCLDREAAVPVAGGPTEPQELPRNSEPPLVSHSLGTCGSE